MPIQRVSVPPNEQAGTAPSSVDQTLAGPGRPLDAALRHDMEQRLGHDFSRVRVHTGASAEQSARDVGATAYAVGHHVVFGRSRFEPQTQEGRRLIAHELTHVVQQSQSSLMFPTSVAPAVVQRKEEDPARARVVKAMEALKSKWGLRSVTEEKGAKWSEAELRRVDAAFSIMAKEDQALLKSMHLVRTDKFEPLVIEEKAKDPKKKKKLKTFPIAGETIGTTVRLAGNAFQGRATTILHEVGHLVHNKVSAEMLAKSRPKRDLEAARTALAAAQKKAPRGSSAEQVALIAALNEIVTAVGDLELSNRETRAASQSALDNLKPNAAMARSQLEMAPQKDPGTPAILQFDDALQVFVEAVEKFVDERDKQNLTEFVAIVNKHGYAKPKTFVPFTDYVASHWPHKPSEYFAEAFRAWRTDRNYMKNNMKHLFEWFEKGGHRVK